MKAITLFYTLALFGSVINAKPFLIENVKPRHAPRMNQKKKVHPQTQKLLSTVRGGDLGGIKSITLAKTFSALTSLDALAGALLPQKSCSAAGIDFSDGSVAHFFCEALGAHAAALTITSYLSSTGACASAEKAIGYGNLARLAVVLKMIVTGRLKALDFEVGAIYSVVTIFAAVTYNLFQEVWEPVFCARLMGVAMVFMGSLLTFDPILMVKSITNYDIEAEDKTAQDIVKVAGGYLLMSGLHTALITSNVDGVRAVGYISLAFVPFMFIFGQMDFKGFFGLSKEVLLALASAILILIGAGILM